jgi:ubiquinone/menaquinone biosynthesis C-methylase UbiE
MAAQRVGPSGYVLAIDVSASMLKLAVNAAREAGLMNVETRVMDAENIDLDANSFDAVICQLGLMVFPDPMKVLAAMRRVLRTGQKNCDGGVLDGGKEPISRCYLGRRSSLRKRNATAFLPRRSRRP